MYSIGLMSGTSMDGIDAVILETDGMYHIQRHAHLSITYEPSTHLLLKATEHSVRETHGDLQKANHVFDQSLTHIIESTQYNDQTPHPTKHQLQVFLQKKLNKAMTTITIEDIIHLSTALHLQIIQTIRNHIAIDCVGYHGQTVFHRPSIQKTIQLGNGQYIANQTGLIVIDQFRIEDVQLGGQGAPLAPIYHQALAVRDHIIPVAIINLGGIANITLIYGASPEELTGFDTGPANCLLDLFVQQKTQGKKHFDENGQFSKNGQIHPFILEKLDQKLPKKTLSGPFSLDNRDFYLIPELDQLSIEDGCATLVAFSVKRIIDALQTCTSVPQQFILCGGGAKNPYIHHLLQKKLHETFHTSIQVDTAESLGWDPQLIEAELMAYLAVRKIKNLPTSFPHITGVPYPISGGTIRRPLYAQDKIC